MAVESTEDLIVDEIFAHRGNVPDVQRPAVGRRTYDDVPNGLGALLDAECANVHVAHRTSHRSAGNVFHPGADGVADLGQAEAVLKEGGLRDIDSQLVLAHAGDDDLAHARQRA